jgi:cell division transport system permease protein
MIGTVAVQRAVGAIFAGLRGGDTRRAGLALGRDDAPLHLDWIIAVMAFLAALSLIGALATTEAAARWRQGLTGTITVEIPALTRPGVSSTDRLQRVLAVLRAEPGITRAEAIPRARIAELLAPWLGTGALADSLPVPQLIDVTLDNRRTDLPALARRLATAAEGTILDDHGQWIAELLRLARLVTAFAIGVVALVALTAVAAVVLATRAGLAVHHEAIDLLHLMGADDVYIARQFAWQSLLLGLRGGAVGLAVALIALVTFGLAAHAVDPKLMPRLWPSPVEIVLLVIVAPVTAGLAWTTARQTVMRALKTKT